MIKTVLIVGCGNMGSQIAELVSIGGYKTLVNDIDENKITDVIALNENIVPIMDLEKELPNHNVDLVIEAISENFITKLTLYSLLDKILPEDTIIVSNTSSINIKALQQASKRKEHFTGLHFFNPVKYMSLVELVGLKELYCSVEAELNYFVRHIGKIPMRVDSNSGYIVNYILFSAINSAIKLYEQTNNTPSVIDDCMVLGAKFNSGPLLTADYIGLDIVLDVLENLYFETGDEAYRPTHLLEKMVQNNELGKKSGKGFYVY